MDNKGQEMDSMGGVDVPDKLPPIKHIDVSDKEYQKLMNLFQPERLNPEASKEDAIV